MGSVQEYKESHCRVCGSSQIVERGHVEFYLGYEWPVYDCSSCGCRFTLHDKSTYDFLYSERGSCYNRYVGQAETCKELFDRGDREGLRALFLRLPITGSLSGRLIVSRRMPASWRLEVLAGI